MSEIGETTPSQAEGERDEEGTREGMARTDPPHTTPSQAEGEREPDQEDVTQPGGS
jgi:hypothetical protein